MYKFIKIQYRLGKMTAAQVKSFIGKYITEEQAKEILGDAFDEADDN